MLDELDALARPDDVAPVLARGLDAARVITAWVLAQPDADVLAGATAYLELVATVVAGVLLAARATAAGADADELADARFFARGRVTLAPALADRITSGTARLDLADG